jgi:hypothetical protein
VKPAIPERNASRFLAIFESNLQPFDGISDINASPSGRIFSLNTFIGFNQDYSSKPKKNPN